MKKHNSGTGRISQIAQSQSCCRMTQESNRIAIYPLFSFEVSEGLEEKIRNGYQFSNKVKLRKISIEEIERFRKTFPLLWGDGAYLIYHINSETYVLEIEGGNDWEEGRLVYEVVLAMRLHKPESVYYKIFRVEEGPKTIAIGSINPSIPLRYEKYVIDNEELGKIDDLVSKITKLDLEKNNSFRVACERFSRSYEERRDDDKIIDLAIAFEALFVDKDISKLEFMGKFVGIGCSMLLGYNSQDREEIKQFLTKTFVVRNDIVHSLKLNASIKMNNKEYTTEQFVVQLQNYLRDSIKKLI